ncbi:MAG: DEAD/DEAH box helicase family protein [Spirochaetales bacterium]|nr:DEAD/DEAH box helicase family protein [Spirochaetales bacterium]
MTKSISTYTIRDVENLLEPHLFEIAKDVQERDGVEYLSERNGTIEAQTTGTSKQLHYPKIIFTNSNLIAKCTCRYEKGICEHVGATLIEFFYRREINKDKRLKILKEMDTLDTKQKAHEIDFLKIKKYSESDDLLPQNKLNQEPKKSYRLVIEFSYCSSFYRGLRITPRYGFIKKDNTIGRLNDITFDKKVEFGNDSIERFFLNSKRYSNQCMPFDIFLRDFEKDLDNLEIYHCLDETKERVIYNEAKLDEICFEISRIEDSSGEYKIRFNPGIKFSTEKQLHIQVILEDEYDSYCEIIDEKLWVLKEQNIYKIELNSYKEGFFLSELLYRYDITTEEILKIIQQSKGLDLRLDFSQKGIIVEHKIPKLILEVSETLDRLMINFLFKYGDREFKYNSEELYFSEIDEGTQKKKIYLRHQDGEKALIGETLIFIINKIGEDRVSSLNMFKGWENFSIFSKWFELNCSLDFFVENFLDELLEKEIEVRWSKNKKRWRRNNNNLKYIASSGIDWLNIQIQFEDKGIELGVDMHQLYLQGFNTEKEWIILNKENIEELFCLVDEAEIDEEGQIIVGRTNFPALEILQQNVESRDDEVKGFLQRIEILLDKEKIDMAKIPTGFKATLRDYQQHGVNWLFFLKKTGFGGCLADDMGLGKTVQTLALVQEICNNKPTAKILIIVPVSTMGNWQREIERFTTGIKAIQHRGTSRQWRTLQSTNANIIITSYATFRNDKEFFSAIKFDAAILDEAQNIKNPRTATFKAVKLIDADFRLTLTGTPVENCTLELWSQMDFLNPSLLGSINTFKKEFSTAIENGDNKAAQRLKQRIKPFILRRKKSDVLKDLPAKEEITEFIDMDNKQAKFYNELKNEMSEMVLKAYDDDPNKAAFIILQALTRLRQAAIDPRLILSKKLSQKLVREKPLIPSAKFDFFKNQIEEIVSQGNKVIVFSQFTKLLDLIEDFLVRNRYPYSKITGQTRNRDEQIEEFQNSTTTNIFLISLKAGGTGINLTAADYVILFDPWWNPAVEAQAVDRAHRIGRKGKVIVYRYITAQTIEDKILTLQAKKRDLVNNLITEDPGFFKSLKREDLLKIFE